VSRSEIPGPSIICACGNDVLLLLVGIHNAWDMVTFLVVGDTQDKTTKEQGARGTMKPGSSRAGLALE
jgi:hypothetical protein